MTATECLEAVSLPGKYEGEAAYVPYFWELECGCDEYGEDEGYTVHIFNVNVQDVEQFPELEGRDTVELVETYQGFVVEVN